MGRDHDIGCLPQGMSRRKRFGVGHVQGRADSSPVERRQQRLCLNQPAARRVHEDRTRFHPRKKISIDDMLRRRSEREQQDHGVRFGQSPGQGFHRLGVRPPVLRNSEHANAERCQPRRDRPSDRTVTNDQHRAPLECVNGSDGRWPGGRDIVQIHVPLTTPLEFQHVRQSAAHGQQHRHHPFRNGGIVHSARIVNRHALRQMGQQPVHTRIERLHGLQPWQGGKERRQLLCVVHSQDSEFHIGFRFGNQPDPLGQSLKHVVVGGLRNEYFGASTFQVGNRRGP